RHVRAGALGCLGGVALPRANMRGQRARWPHCRSKLLPRDRRNGHEPADGASHRHAGVSAFRAERMRMNTPEALSPWDLAVLGCLLVVGTLYVLGTFQVRGRRWEPIAFGIGWSAL